MAPRDEVVDYTLPVFPRITLTLWQPLVNRAPLNYTAFIDVFPMNVWMLIGLTFLVIAVVFYIIDKSGSNQFHEAIHSEGFGFLNSVALSAILLIQLSYPVMVKSLSARIIYLVGCLGAYMLFFYYQCDLTAQMTIVGVRDELRNFQGGNSIDSIYSP